MSSRGRGTMRGEPEHRLRPDRSAGQDSREFVHEVLTVQVVRVAL